MKSALKDSGDIVKIGQRDIIATLNPNMEKALNQRKILRVLIVDFCQAFHTVDHEILQQAQGISGNLFEVHVLVDYLTIL